MWRFVSSVLFVIGIILALGAITAAYEWVRKKINKPKIGFPAFLLDKIKRGDYVCIEGKVLRFNHIARENESIDILHPPLHSNQTLGGELAFDNGLGYLYYRPSALNKCEFIYGKYGLKWAISNDWAKAAKSKIKNIY